MSQGNSPLDFPTHANAHLTFILPDLHPVGSHDIYLRGGEKKAFKLKGPSVINKRQIDSKP